MNDPNKQMLGQPHQEFNGLIESPMQDGHEMYLHTVPNTTVHQFADYEDPSESYEFDSHYVDQVVGQILTQPHAAIGPFGMQGFPQDPQAISSVPGAPTDPSSVLPHTQLTTQNLARRLDKVSISATSPSGSRRGTRIPTDVSISGCTELSDDSGDTYVSGGSQSGGSSGSSGEFEEQMQQMQQLDQTEYLAFRPD